MNQNHESVNLSLPPNKRDRADDRNEVVLASRKKRKVRKLSWAKELESRQATPPCLPEGYDAREIWYSRKEYDEFLVDRVRTVQCLRACGGSDKALDAKFYCIRGLEPFQTADVHEEFNSKRHFHQSTIIIEQVRQSMMKIRDPERFRLLVAPQSEMALRRAQEIAALDEHEVYNRVCRRGSLIAPMPKTLSSSSDGLTLSLSDRVRRLQEWNARRLAEIYSQPGNGTFRFTVRRDSLAGVATTRGMGRMTGGTRFPIRRDSLTPMSATHK
eukprot:CAMPEP_0117024580 /NCGR_PEP_ID=MMETSP0472-20121206/18236_1 /TAXON_ID=693140 ORGANISM="Tiarina fusus, Strain LIS" /NCGR_SAMPLE_ID=MMETSP0472 /ASSEMBLY_ACC=CAM_ASM_000603 /LENGTH=270 /DNA_ID=CAMNT_0004731043 /DNA_START=170 /DNA_END=982 /DNA_ORIENTATION=+